MIETIVVEGITNEAFIAEHARPGRIGLVGGSEPINRLISRAQRHLSEDKTWSCWTHAFIFQGKRADGHHWVIESDLDIRRKHIRLGVQENRVGKYFEAEKYGSIAVLDLGLTPEQEQQLLSHALELVSSGARYSLRELAGTVWAMKHPQLRPKENLLSRDQSYYCSAFVSHVFGRIGFDLAAGFTEKNTTPEDIARLTVPHKKWVMIREVPASRAKALVKRVKAKLHRKK
jgi:hypothetical protein